MSILSQNSTPADRAIGCTFAENFVSNADVVLNGGTVSGLPAIDFGATFDGTNDYITYALNGNELDSAEISIVIDFEPDFDTDEDVSRYLMDSTDGIRYLIFKRDNASNNTLTIYFANTSIASITEATYSPFWNVNARNVLVISGTSGDTNAWLNGNQILTNDSTVWTPEKPTILTAGSRHDGTGNFDGKINSLKIYQSLLTAKDALNFYDNSTYDYMNNTVLNLQMRAEDHDPTNVRALDVSGNDNHATLGDGTTSTTYPTKLSKRGYDFDGGDYLNVPYDSTLDISSEVTLAILLTIPVMPSGGTNFHYILGRGADYNDFQYALQINNVGDFYFGVNNYNTGTSYSSKIGSVQSVICVNDGVNSIMYVDGVEVDRIADTMTTYGTSPLGIMAETDSGASRLTIGELHQSLIFDRGLTPLQVADLHLSMMKKINTV